MDTVKMITELKGRRLPIHTFDRIPAEIKAGDYWQVGDGDDPGSPVYVDHKSNLTKTVWRVAAPMSYGYAIGTLTLHTVRENEDGTISVLPGDGSSNSILITGHDGEIWHGYIYNGVWRAV